MSEAPSAPLPIIKRARSGPVHRGLESKVLNVSGLTVIFLIIADLNLPLVR